MKNKGLLTLLVLALTIFTFMFGTSCGTKTTSEMKTLKVGANLPLTGPASVAGLAFKQGWDMAVEKINNEGGIKIGGETYKLDLLIEDDMASPESASTAAQKLCYQDNVKFMFSSLAAVLNAPAYDIAKESGALTIISLAPSSETSPGAYFGVGSDKPLLIRFGFAGDENSVYTFKYLAENYPNVKTVGMMALDFPEYRQLNEKYNTDLAPLGMTVGPDYELFPADCMDFTPYVSRLLATKPDAIFIYASAPPHSTLIMKTAREAGFNGPVVYGPPLDPTFVLGAAPNLSDFITPGFPMDASNLPGPVKDAIELGRAKYGNDLVQDALNAYDLILVYSQLMEKAKSTDPQKVLETFETLTKPGDLKSIYGDSNAMGAETIGVNRILKRPVPVSVIKNGQGQYIGMFD